MTKIPSLSSALPLVLVIFALGGCTGPVIMGGDAAVIAVTKPGEPPPADTQDQIPRHESWCYSTMGYAECYAHPQVTQANRLINVDPQNRYPVDPQAYREALAADKAATMSPPSNAAPTSLTPAPTVDVEKDPGAAPQPDVQSISKLPQ